MTEQEKKLLQAKHRMEEAEARNRKKGRSLRTRRLIQEGAILESVFPRAQHLSIGKQALFPGSRAEKNLRKLGGFL